MHNEIRRYANSLHVKYVNVAIKAVYLSVCVSHTPTHSHTHTRI